jgi:hypothetical protein
MIAIPVLALAAFMAVTPGSNAPCVSMTERLIAEEAFSDEEEAGIRLFFPHFCRFLEADLPAEQAAVLMQSRSLHDFRSRLGSVTGGDVFDLGERMLAYYEATARPPQVPVRGETHESEHFVFVFSADSPAAADIALIARTSEEIWKTIGAVLALQEDLETGRRLLATRVDRGSGTPADCFDGKLPIYLHAHRSEDGATRIPSHSYGTANLGATIIDGNEPALSGSPRLTSRIDVLYLNPFSLVVLHHEIAHAVLLLGSFDHGALAGKTISGKSALKKAFFAGYRKVPLFLHEALGDYAFYYRGFYRVWPILIGSPEEIIVSLEERRKTIPLARLLKEDRRFRAANHKTYSLQAASFIAFLSETRGEDRMRRWLLADDVDGARSFRKIYGVAVEAVEAEWLDAVRARAKIQPTDSPLTPDER